MKLFSWMHRKLQGDETGPFNSSALGNPCLSLKPSLGNQDDYVRSGNNFKLRYENYLGQFKGEETIDVNKEELTEIFPGFLTIGTLSVEPATGPPTPTFDLTQQKTYDQYGTRELKYDLKCITEELENFLRDEAEKEGNNEPSGRNSQVSNITLSDIKEKEEVDDYKYMDIQSFPLQGYLLASCTELSEIIRRGKKERTSLQELFQSSVTMDKHSFKATEEPKNNVKKKIKSSTRIINKMMQAPWPSLKDSTTSTGSAVKSFATVTKLRKIKQLFHKKVHPQLSPVDKDPNMFSNNETRYGESYAKSPAPALDCESARIGCWGTLVKREKSHPNTDIKLPPDASPKEYVNTAPSYECGTACKEKWINTDADYLVLELAV